MKGVICCLLYLMWFHASFTASAQKPFDVEDLKKTPSAPLLHYMSYFASAEKHHIDSVVRLRSEAFTPAGAKAINFGFTDQYFHFRFFIQNNSGKEEKLFLISENPALNQVQLFKIVNGKAHSLGLTGDHFPFNQRPYPFNTFVFPITITSSGTDSFYLFIDKKNENLELGITLYRESAFVSYSQHLYLVTGILSGILVMAFLFHLFLFLNTKELLHLWYCLYSLSVLYFFFAMKTIDFQLFYPNYPFWTNISKYFIGNTSMLLLLLVMQSFFSQTKDNSRFWHLVNIMKFLLAIWAIGAIVIYAAFPLYTLKQIVHNGSMLLLLSGVILIYATCIEQLRMGYRLALVYMVAVSFMGIPILFTALLFLYTGNSLAYTQPNPIEIGSVLEALVICFAILYRYLLIRKQKELLVLEVQEQKSNMMKSIVNIQESEKKRFAQDLHDELGGDLAAIKLSLQAVPLQDEKLTPVLQMIDKASASVRNISHNLMPPEFADTPLPILLQAYFRQLSVKGKVFFSFYCTGYREVMTKEEELIIYRIILELTNNVNKHANASEASLQLIYFEDKLELMIEDNGQGFLPGNTHGMGIHNVQSRVSYLQGNLNIDSSRHGTTIIIHLPFKK